MLQRCVLVLLVVLGCGLFGGPLPATAGPAPADDVSHREYRAISLGMTRAEVNAATHGAEFRTDRAGECRLRFYTGWNRRHANVGVLLDADHRVVDKQSWGDDEGFVFLC